MIKSMRRRFTEPRGLLEPLVLRPFGQDIVRDNLKVEPEYLTTSEIHDISQGICCFGVGSCNLLLNYNSTSYLIQQ